MRTDLRERLDSLLADYRSTRAELESLTADVAALTGEGRSDDRSVTAVVGPQGQLIDLRLDPVALERADARTLAARVLQASTAAGEQVRAVLRERLERALPQHLHGLLAADGSLDVSRLLPPSLDELGSGR